MRIVNRKVTTRESVYLVATVILGGSVTSTQLELLVRPARSWLVGVDAARAVVEAEVGSVVLVEESVTLS